MEPNLNKIDDAVLALLHVTTFQHQGCHRAWKGFDWEVLDRLHEKGLIADPKNRNKSVILTEEGLQRSRELFEKFFA